MLRINTIILTFLCLAMLGCKSEEHRFPLEKRYWDTNDYEEAVLELKYGYKSDEELPTFKNPETRAIIEKLTDEGNYKIVLDDEQLGIKHKNEVANTFFDVWINMSSIYTALDRNDNYTYEKEMLEVYKFGLGLQLRYFKLGNDVIIENADDPNSKKIRSYIDANIDTIISNFLNYLDEINTEESLSNEGKVILADGIDEYFPKLLELYPKADYYKMKSKVDLLLNKSESDVIKTSLKNLKSLIDSQSNKEQ